MIHDFLTSIDFLKELTNERLVNITEEEMLDSCQLGFGHLVEYNLVSAMKYCSKANHIKVVKTNEDFDRLFGADAHVEFIAPMSEKINGMSCYIDVTLSDKPMLKFNSGAELCTLSNGFKLSIGYKNKHHDFLYEKPVILLMLKCDYYKKITPIFTKEDIKLVVKYLRQACLYLSYDFKYMFNHKTKVGTGKCSSTYIQINENILLG